jgi:eukaryotic-like serine/threonine-protein kinase
MQNQDPIADTVAPRRSLPPGTRLGRYSILEPLGSGGMGVVYRAHDEKLEREVAIKTLAPGVFAGDQAREHFRREALALAKLNHPNIAAVYDVGQQDGLDYIVMECVPGQSLAAKLSGGALTVRESTTIVLQVAEALEEAHRQGVIHRDLKPANVLITPRGNAKVLDFGLAKLFASSDATLSMAETQGILGTPLYMSPEQASGQKVDARTDLWSLGVLYYQCLTGQVPFNADSNLAVLRAITESPLRSVRELRPDIPSQAASIVDRALQKSPAERYQTSAAIGADASSLLAQLSGASALPAPRPRKPLVWIAAALALVLIALSGVWLYQRAAQRRWARDEAIPQITQLLNARTPLAAFQLLDKARRYLPSDPALQSIADEYSESVSITSDPSGAQVEFKDYLTPNAEWKSLGITPLTNIRIPNGYFRWRVSKPGLGSIESAPETNSSMNFSLTETLKSPPGMVFDPGGSWGTYVGFIGWLGPYKLPPFYIDRYEVTNRDYQKFVDSGGYLKAQYWPASFQQNGHTLTWADGMAQFRDSTGRPGPSTWTGGHYPDGQADFPVAGVSWFEASAYAAFAGKSLPALGQWYQAAPPDEEDYTVQFSNITTGAAAAVGTYKGIGPYGTYDTAGNVREWTANTVDNDLRFILGGSWKSPAYLYADPEALSPFDRAEGNGFRCVRNTAPLPENASRPFHLVGRDFTKFKPVNDDVFRAYQLLYAYPNTPLNAKVEGVVKETADWREEKVSFNTAYNGDRMAAYLFLPKRVRPPYQTVLFFPSARVMLLPPDSSELGDTKFFDYIVQSGRAVMYPIYEDTYERRIKYSLPGGAQNVNLTTDWYKDAARSMDYLNTRSDIDSSRVGYLGVSMGSAYGVIYTTLLQDRLKAAIFLDGGYFLQPTPPGGDQADFAPRMKEPVLMVNGRYDYTFPVDKAQDPMFQMLGTPAADKSHVILDTPHDVTEQRPLLVKAVLDWLDRYLGRVAQ